MSNSENSSTVAKQNPIEQHPKPPFPDQEQSVPGTEKEMTPKFHTNAGAWQRFFPAPEPTQNGQESIQDLKILFSQRHLTEDALLPKFLRLPAFL